MSSIDPTLAAAQALVRSAETAIADAALDLGTGAGEIVAQIRVGDLLAATVLPPQGGSDLLEIFGRTVAAQLPPGIHPGETIALQVDGFDGQRILVSNRGIVDPQNPPDLVRVVAPPPEATGAPARATLTAVTPRPQAAPPTAPPREVFVAASVRPAPPAAAPVPETPVARPLAVEARMASAPRVAPPAVPPVAPPAQGAPGAAAAPAAAHVPAPPPAQRALPLAAFLTARAPAPAAAAAAPRDDATRLLERLRVPATPLTLAAARIANGAVASLPRAFARLEAVLPRELPIAAAPLRALLAFVARIELGNARALPEQIAAFVAHVVDGAEPKLAQTLVALDATRAAPSEAPASPRAASDAAAPPAAMPVAAHARAAERAAALAFDLKSALGALAGSAEGASPHLAQAIAEVATAVAGVQIGVLANLANDPSAISLALPAFYRDGGEPVRLRIDRDAPGGGKALDPDNFRIGFVLDTAALGTLAIDVETVGRSVRVDVRTERAPAAARIEGTLPDLRARFEHLHYRVAAMSAGVAPSRAAAPTPAPAPGAPAEPAAGLDLRA